MEDLSADPVRVVEEAEDERKKSSAFRSSINECVEARARKRIRRKARVEEEEEVSMSFSTYDWI
jgi:hypothetical protein